MILGITWNLCTIDWTAVSAIASFAMVALTVWTLKQSKKQNDATLAQNEKILQNNKEQLEELKRQWNAERNPCLLFSFVFSHQSIFLKISNIGLMPAYNIRLSINEDFYNELSEKVAKEVLCKLAEPFFIEGRGAKYVFIETVKEINTLKDKVLKINGNYCEDKVVNFSCDLNDIINRRFARIEDSLTLALEDIDKSISSAKTDGNYDTIQKSLHNISKSVSNYIQEMKEVSKGAENGLRKNKEKVIICRNWN